MKSLFFSIFLIGSLFNSALFAQASRATAPTPQSASFQEGMPQWNKEDLAKFLQGEAFAGEDLIPQEDEQADPEIAGITTIETPVPDNDSSMDAGTIAPGFLPLYNPQDKNQLLIDPQSILTSQESADIAQLLRDIKEVTNVTIYLTVFGKDQKIPPALNAPTLSREIFDNRNDLILVEYHLDNFLKTQVIYSNDIGFALDTDKRRKILDFVQIKAAEFTNTQDRLWHLLYSLGKQIPTIKAYVKKAKLDHTNDIVIPVIDYPAPAKQDTPDNKSTDFLQIAKDFFFTFGLPILCIILFVGTFIGGIFYINSRKRYQLISHHGPSDKRLGAPNGTNTARVLYYSRQTKKSKKEEELLREFFNFKP